LRSPVQVPIRSKIDAVILQKGLKKKWIAEQLGISQSYLSQMTKTDENGLLQNAMSAEYLLKLADVLGVKVEEIAEYVKDGL
jgi:DNA-binding Xre family transcriptional regulator